MLKNKIIFNSNFANSINSFNTNSSSMPNTLFQLMQKNILIINTPILTMQNDETKKIQSVDLWLKRYLKT